MALDHYWSSFPPISLFLFSLSLFICKHSCNFSSKGCEVCPVVYVCHMSVCERLHVRVCPGVCVHAIVWRGVSGSHPRSWWSVWSLRHSVWIWGSSRRGASHRESAQLNRVITLFHPNICNQYVSYPVPSWPLHYSHKNPYSEETVWTWILWKTYLCLILKHPPTTPQPKTASSPNRRLSPLSQSC